jgi:chemotaxis protein MotB
MSHVLALVASASLLLGVAGGCVSQEKYNALKLDRDALAESFAKAQSDCSGARAEADSYKNQLAQLIGNGNNLQGLISNLNSENASLRSQLDALNSKYSDAMNRPAGGTALPPELSNALSQFAQQNPDLVDFDAARGVVKFKSDVTFAVGDATLNPRAKEVITRFASILNSSAANGYELMVAGHTDNQRVSNPRTISAGHKDNWYLSAHRAISVSNELMTERVNPQRIAVVGYADQRPIASNASASGQQLNRRVEVLILPTTVRSTSPMASGETPKRGNKRGGGNVNMNKDSTAGNGEMNRPVLNK